MSRIWSRSWVLRTAMVAFAASALAPLWVLSKDRDEVPASAPTRLSVEKIRLPELIESPGPGDEYLVVAVESAPFSAQRTPPRRRFEPPRRRGDDAEALLSYPGEEVSSGGVGPPLVLLGTMILPDGRGVALVHTSPDEARLLRVGESIGDLTLRGVHLGSAEFMDGNGSIIEIDVERQGA